MTEHRVGTREEWQAARDDLAKLEAEQAQRNEEIKRKRLDLPWVPVAKEYEFDTEDGRKTLAELFDGRSQLLAYNVMFGPDYTLGACPGFNLALTPQQAQAIPQVKEMIDNPPEWLEDWGRQVGAKLEDGLREGPSWIAFARDNGTVYHTYAVMAPDPFVAPYYSFLLDRTPQPQPEHAPARPQAGYPA